ncbi:MAG: hypothetical protein CMP11_05160 [Zetaproteobacteria bacterium]|nr:hypothetical protein [Pseudobdellovibrionaceae bacterium]|tara:strand:+ start:152 stop:550 length:399 start_codon:yes stop_codon:yes gene_type:complete
MLIISRTTVSLILFVFISTQKSYGTTRSFSKFILNQRSFLKQNYFNNSYDNLQKVYSMSTRSMWGYAKNYENQKRSHLLRNYDPLQNTLAIIGSINIIYWGVKGVYHMPILFNSSKEKDNEVSDKNLKGKKL